mmetsp:Transcript_20464/g.65874  ORF Transcript_20464/g.65874 Transcript_20464/m.65874 type:complete len:484 (+) Transcript_20464:1099-2550(+)
MSKDPLGGDRVDETLFLHHARLPLHEVLVDVGVVGEEEGGVRRRGRHVANLAQRLVMCRRVQGVHLLEVFLRARILLSRAVLAFEGAGKILLLAVLPLDPGARVVGVGARVEVLLRVPDQGVLLRSPVPVRRPTVQGRWCRVETNVSASSASVRVAGDIRGARPCVERRPAHVGFRAVAKLARAVIVVGVLVRVAAALAVLGRLMKVVVEEIILVVEAWRLAERCVFVGAPGVEVFVGDALVGHAVLGILHPVLVVKVGPTRHLPIRPAPVRDFKVWAGPDLLAEVRVRPDVLLRVAARVRVFRVIVVRAEQAVRRGGAVEFPGRFLHSPVEVEDRRAVQRHVPPRGRADFRVDGEHRRLKSQHVRLVEQHEARRAVALVAARVRCCAGVQVDEIGKGPGGLAEALPELLGRMRVHDVESARVPVDLILGVLAPLLPLPGERQVGGGVAGGLVPVARRAGAFLEVVFWKGALPWGRDWVGGQR